MKHTIIFAVAILSMVVHLKATRSMFYDAVIKDRIIIRYYLVLTDNESITICALKCFSDTNCLSFAFNGLKRECYLYDSYVLPSESSLDDVGTTIFNESSENSTDNQSTQTLYDEEEIPNYDLDNYGK
ncbi:hypothetical protein LOTGIDRAFT_172887 [Lottia gigantea]|uniref:Apple domain-containing protein n=1 Tax=Lottia gigantea TaxID=225164 RepID=V4CFZ0_LOTGI|nr:hypothetical protein LOTGIDRAFT_172887 [Lottia gigantea]ESP00960.1 hypothetical protein LOTGIDRAFT_172887 [Lottia gigantea]